MKWLGKAVSAKQDWFDDDSPIWPRLQIPFRVLRRARWRRQFVKLKNALMRQSLGRLRPQRLLLEVVQLAPEMDLAHGVRDFRWLFAPRLIEVDRARHAALLSHTNYFELAPLSFQTPFVCRLQNPKIHLGEGVLITPVNAILLDSAFAWYRLAGSTVWSSRAPVKVPVLDGCYSSIWGLFAFNTFHWLVDCLPRLHSLELATQKPLTLLMPASATAYQRESLACCLPDGMEVLYLENRGWLQVSEFVFPSYLTLAQFAALPIEYSDALRKRVWKKLGLSPERAARKRIYISRRSARERRVLNESAVEKCLEKWGFESVRLEDLTFGQQVELFYDAEIVVGAHGAGLSNILFARDIKVVELQTTEVRLHYFFLSQGLSHPYASVLAPPRPGSSHFVVPLDELEAALSSVL